MQTWPWREVEGSGTAREIEIVLQTLDMLVPDGEGAYLAAPISTGSRYYEALARNGVTTYTELIAAIGIEQYLSSVRWPNVADGERTAADLRERGVPYVINTGPLMVLGWQGTDYMNLCFRLIERKVRRVYFHPEWAFSTGAVKEYLFCYRRGLPCLRLDGQPMRVDEARANLADVCRYIRSRSILADSLESKLRELDQLAGTPLGVEAEINRSR